MFPGALVTNAGNGLRCYIGGGCQLRPSPLLLFRSTVHYPMRRILPHPSRGRTPGRVPSAPSPRDLHPQCSRPPMPPPRHEVRASAWTPSLALIARSLAVEWPPLGLGFRGLALGQANRLSAGDDAPVPRISLLKMA
jgi:hypothetical protein